MAPPEKRRSRRGRPYADPIGLAIRAEMTMRVLLPTRAKTRDIAQSLRVSKSTLHRAMNGAYGTGVAEHFLKMRVDAAKALLLKGEKVAHVAHCVGFASEGGFRNAFRQIAGISAGRYAQGGRAGPPPPETAPTFDCGRYF